MQSQIVHSAPLVLSEMIQASLFTFLPGERNNSSMSRWNPLGSFRGPQPLSVQITYRGSSFDPQTRLGGSLFLVFEFRTVGMLPLWAPRQDPELLLIVVVLRVITRVAIMLRQWVKGGTTSSDHDKPEIGKVPY